MSQRKIFKSLDGHEIHYTPRSEDRERAPSIINIDGKDHVVEDKEIGTGKYGEVHAINSTNLLRKKGRLDKINYENLKKELFFHKKYYGLNSIVVRYCSDKTKEVIPAEKIEEKIAAEEKITYCLIRKNIEGKRLSKKLEEYKTDRKKALFLYLKTAERLVNLHNHGIIHGDPHFNNFIVDENDNVLAIDFGNSYSIDGHATMASDEKHQINKAYAPERRRSTNPTADAKADVTQDTYTYGFWVTSTLQETNLLSESKDNNIHELLQLMQSDDPSKRPKLKEIIDILATAYNKTLPETHYVPEIRRTYAAPLISVASSSSGLFANTHSILGLGKVGGTIALLCAQLPVGVWVLLLFLSSVWLARNIYVNCISSTNSEVLQVKFRVT